MSLNGKRMAVRFMLFGLLGLAFEVWGTAFVPYQGNRWLVRGLSSPWMIPIYGLLGIVFEPIRQQLVRRKTPYLLRAAIYMAAIFLVEYAAGMLFLAVGLNQRHASHMDVVWDYSGLPLNLHGQICLLWTPIWYVTGLVLEPLYRWVDACATTLVLGLGAEDLMKRGAPPDA